jgi:hypothetical protein
MPEPSTFINDFEPVRRLKLIATATLPELNQIMAAIHEAEIRMPPIPSWIALKDKYKQASVQRNIRLLRPGIFSRQ